ncbi:Putative aminoglycoside phosphotransferase [Rubrivivax sp. A210]|uniref:aminoglycoside phosphotransferase family protein n=1 Tax=Rubrivivax sp. A210 TaxID=2772301 RepID=UPI00191B4A17|nr:aminoglycoside phosphotransferase family protein [Rubrivivax sp. A210]CAD5373921.1 Putative aminoglycoside phosphotransferase [Rubrivivax sp. A210]
MMARQHDHAPALAGGSAPPLDLYSDGAAMLPLLQAQLPGFGEVGLRITGIRVHAARRSTSVARNPIPLSLCYDLEVSDTQQGRSGTQTCFAQVYRPGLAEAAQGRVNTRQLVRPAFGEPLVLLPALNLLLWALPNDPDMPHLPALLDPALALQALPPGCGAEPGDELGVELLRYAPQRRATLRYTVAARAGRPERAIYAKTFFDQRARDIHRRFEHFWQLSQRDPLAPLVAEPLGHDAATRSVWQASALGLPLLQALASPQAPQLMERVAQALVLLHESGLQPTAGAAPHSVPHWLAEVSRRRNKLDRIKPELAERTARIAATLTAHAARPAQRPLSLIHGDCHPDQMWVHEGRIVLFDFDEFTLGDPMEDLASFVLKLEQAEQPEALGRALVRAYAAAAPRRFDAQALAWHLAIQSLLQVSRTFIYQRPGWAEELDSRLAAAETRILALQLSHPA